MVRLGLWTFGFVVANQVALFVVLALAVGAKGNGTVSSWTYAYTFMQMPYAVVAVSVMSAVTPDLSALVGPRRHRCVPPPFHRWPAGGALDHPPGGRRAC